MKESRVSCRSRGKRQRSEYYDLVRGSNNYVVVAKNDRKQGRETSDRTEAIIEEDFLREYRVIGTTKGEWLIGNDEGNL
jgi:hypothetical protein